MNQLASGNVDPSFAAWTHCLGHLAAAGATPMGLGRLMARLLLEQTRAKRVIVRLPEESRPWRAEAIRESDGIAVIETESSRMLPRLAGIDRPATTAEMARITQIDLVCDGTVFGNVTLEAATAPLSDADRAAAETLVASFIPFLSLHRQLNAARQLAARDELTGLFNRRYLGEALDVAIAAARRDRRPVSLFLLDVDHFKRFNDTWGHATGDRVLQVIGQLIRSTFRAADIACRYGGEEFAVVLTAHGTGDDSSHRIEAVQFAERLRGAAEHHPLVSRDGQVLSHVTISGGLATFPWDAATPEELLRAADEALYRAKRAGRNRVLLASTVPVAECRAS